jgi:hypothetical protein
MADLQYVADNTSSAEPVLAMVYALTHYYIFIMPSFWTAPSRCRNCTIRVP